MRKVSPKTKTPKTPKQKRRIRDANKYLKPGALAQLRNSKASASGSGLKSKSCMDLGKKRVAVLDAGNNVGGGLFENKSAGNETAIILSPQRFRYGPFDKESNLQRTPSTPSTPRPEQGNRDYESQLESLPMELLVKILCHMHHDQLKAVFHVSERIRKAVIIARRFHFNYKTPDRSRQEMLNTMTPLPTQHWPFVSKEDDKRKAMTLPRTPKAPRHGPRPPSRLNLIEMRQVAAALFQESAFSPKYILPKPKFKSFPSMSQLFDEELELCQAVAQNKLL